MVEKKKLREGWYGADTEVEFDDSVFSDIKKYFKLPEEVEILNAYYFVDEVTVDYEDANGNQDSIDMHVPLSTVEEWFKAGYTILDESVKKPQAKKSNLTERFMQIHEKPSTRFNKNLKKVYEMLDKYGTEKEDVDKVFNRATLKERLEMVKLLKEGTKILKPTNYVIAADYAGENFLPEVYLLGWDNNEDWYTVDIDGSDIMTPSGSVKKNSWGLIDVTKMISAYVGETAEECADYADGARNEGYDCTICHLEKDNEGNIRLTPVED